MPGSGGQPRAIAGTLASRMAEGMKSLQDCQDLFKAMGKNIFYCGRNGNGEVTKVVNNLLGAIQGMALHRILLNWDSEPGGYEKP